jgi:hypothetical protein
VDYLVDATPEECLDAATAYLVGRGYSIETRAGNTATFTRAPKLGREAQLGLALGIAISLGTAAVILGALYLMGYSQVEGNGSCPQGANRPDPPHGWRIHPRS